MGGGAVGLKFGEPNAAQVGVTVLSGVVSVSATGAYPLDPFGHSRLGFQLPDDIRKPGRHLR